MAGFDAEQDPEAAKECRAIAEQVASPIRHRPGMNPGDWEGTVKHLWPALEAAEQFIAIMEAKQVVTGIRRILPWSVCRRLA